MGQPRKQRRPGLSIAHRPAYLLSGLLDCGTCGGHYAIVVSDRYGCIGHHRSRACSNCRMIRQKEPEQRALEDIADRLVSTDKIEAAIAAYPSHINQENLERRIRRKTR